MATITMVCDSPDVLSVAATTLRARGHDVRESLGGRDALRTLADGRTDLLITDARLPDMSGLELIGQTWRVEPELPVIIMTGYFTEAAVSRDKLGPAVVLSKPFLPKDLVRAVETAMMPRGRLAA